ncbi:PIN domain-containing protein [Belliella kenyensis]|uniref:PIN domain-containing protein n=1 Tax=Belliella kenyensis TaxID=1472724 RepID=A0ABV8EG49_9BACT|nr:PIN domain-containing protein [Belliella kenyensis]MCH7400932.1 PIN domain-containing protein [Belliella kenyensis]MDN3603931.1 PIN domain-containing protein [Belliella kenyensis]
MKAVLLDSDIILDAMTDRIPFSSDAIAILNLCEKKEVLGFTTPVILSNLYYLLRRLGMSHMNILDHFRNLVTNILFDIVTIDKKSVLDAINSGFSDFEDALQNFSAENHQKISIIITRNTKDYKNSNLAIMSPKEFLSSLK